MGSVESSGAGSLGPACTRSPASGDCCEDMSSRSRTGVKPKARVPGWKARRWVVEATHSWLNRNRGILIRWSKKKENHLALLQLGCGLIAFKKANSARLTPRPNGIGPKGAAVEIAMATCDTQPGPCEQPLDIGRIVLAQPEARGGERLQMRRLRAHQPPVEVEHAAARVVAPVFAHLEVPPRAVGEGARQEVPTRLTQVVVVRR